MLRGSFGHRRFSITHRAVQRLRELVPTMEDLDDEALRDQLDRSLATADAEGKALRTIDAMLGEPQVLVPLSEFGETLYAIVKEDTVVTVLPQGHGEEILQRGRAMQERVAAGTAAPERPAGEEPRRELRRTPWRRDPLSGDPIKGEPAVTVVHRGGRPPGAAGTPAFAAATTAPAVASSQSVAASSDEDTASSVNVAPATTPAPARRRFGPRAEGDVRNAETPSATPNRRPADKIGQALFDALAEGRRQATIRALREVVREQRGLDKAILPACEGIFEAGLPLNVTLRDLVLACSDLASAKA